VVPAVVMDPRIAVVVATRSGDGWRLRCSTKDLIVLEEILVEGEHPLGLDEAVAACERALGVVLLPLRQYGSRTTPSVAVFEVERPSW
jgi:hypothetical protein